ncbi:leucine-rich single-pass membrane protein 1-like [Lepisosteus oculatus]|uniref:leucine-rich single-pass membrane protein 1-like n=1 Tax=Lepisosteus oculatus TaxID=7918 RepID=UPI003723E571
MGDIALETEIDILDEEGKLYAADSLNNLNKLNVCSDPQLLLSAELPFSPQDNATQDTKGNQNDTQERPKAADGHSPLEEGKSHETWCSCSRCLCIFLIILAVALAASLVLSSFAIYLTAQTTRKVEELSSNDLYQEILKEMKGWKVLISEYLNISAAENQRES